MRHKAIRLLGSLVTIVLLGCSQNVAKWDARRIESWITNEWEMASVELVLNEDGTHSGSGIDKAGKTFTFKVTQDPASKVLSCSRIDANGRVVDGKALRNY